MKRVMIVLTALMVVMAASSVEAGLFNRKNKNKCCQPVCCQPVCCEATPVCYSEPVCPCEAAPAPCGCEAAPAAPCGCSAAAPCGCEVSQCGCESMTRREARKARRAGCCTTCSSCSACSSSVAPCGYSEVQGCSSCGGAAVEGCSSCGEAAGSAAPEPAPQAPQNDSTT